MLLLAALPARNWKRARTADPCWPKEYPIPYILASNCTAKLGERRLLLLSDR